MLETTQEKHHKKWTIMGMAAVLFMLMLFNGIGVVNGSENWTVYDDGTNLVTVEQDNEENLMIVTFPEDWLSPGEDNIRYRLGLAEMGENENEIYYNNMLVFYPSILYTKFSQDGRYFGRFDGIGIGLIYVDTSSPVVVVNFDYYATRTVYFTVAGPTGTKGDITLHLAKGEVASPENVKGYLDNQQMDLTITENGDYYDIKAEYTHSVRTITINLGSMLASPWYAQPLNLAIIAVAVFAVAAAVYLLRLRR